MINLDQFDTKAAGKPEFEIQGMFASLASVHEPKGGLNMGVSADMGYDPLTHG